MLATLGSNGEMHRLFWPGIDMAQNLNATWPAVLSPAFGDKAVRLNDKGNWVYSQEYINDTNILKTLAKAKRFELQVTTLDFVVPDRDIVVRRYQLTNLSGSPVPVVFIYYASFFINEGNLYNTTCFDNDYDIMLHYRRGIWFGVAGNKVPTDYQCGWCSESSLYGNFDGKSLAMSPDGCQAWNLGVLKPGESKSIQVYITAGSTRQQVLENVFYTRKCGIDRLLQETADFWETYLKQGFAPTRASENIQRVFRRSVMVCKLLMNRDTGGIIAAPEFDESYSRCGGYAYCWGRDGAFVAHAMLKAGYPGYARDFYRWAANNQNPAGDWPQRQYTNGQLAPRWGEQIDSTGTIIWGISQYYKETGDSDFLEEMWPTVARAAEFLTAWLNDESDLARMSWDLWEERFGEHAYSFAAVYAGLKGAGHLAETAGKNELALKWLEASISLKEKILDYFWDPDLQRFIRTRWKSVSYHDFENIKRAGGQIREIIGPKGYITYEVYGDDRADASLLGLTVPFGVITPDDIRMRKTVNHLEESLTNRKVGGLHRYSGDPYIGGNPWVLTTLWLGMFNAAAGHWKKSGEYLRWALRHRTALDFLPEQVDRSTGQPAWVIPLVWSHAMYLWLVVIISETNRFSWVFDEGVS